MSNHFFDGFFFDFSGIYSWFESNSNGLDVCGFRHFTYSKQFTVYTYKFIYFSHFRFIHLCAPIFRVLIFVKYNTCRVFSAFDAVPLPKTTTTDKLLNLFDSSAQSKSNMKNNKKKTFKSAALFSHTHIRGLCLFEQNNV